MTSNKRKKEQKHIRRLMMLPVLLIYKLHFANGAQRAMINNKIRQDRNRQQTHLPSTVSLPRKQALNGKRGEWSACLTWALFIVFQMFFFPYHGVKRKFTSATIIILYLYIFHMNPNVFLLNYECGYKHQSISCCDAPTHPDLSKQNLTTGRYLSKKRPHCDSSCAFVCFVTCLQGATGLLVLCLVSHILLTRKTCFLPKNSPNLHI